MAQKKWNSSILVNNFAALERHNVLSSGSSSSDEVGIYELKETALAAYDQALLLAPHEAILHYHKGLLLTQLGRSTEAARSLEDARVLTSTGCFARQLKIRSVLTEME